MKKRSLIMFAVLTATFFKFGTVVGQIPLPVIPGNNTTEIPPEAPNETPVPEWIQTFQMMQTEIIQTQAAISATQTQAVWEMTFDAFNAEQTRIAQTQAAISATQTQAAEPTQKPTATPTKIPTSTPTKIPTATPTKIPTSTPTKKPTSTPTKISLYCPGAAGPRLTKGEYAYVCASDGVWLKDKPGYGTLIHYLSSGTKLKVLSGPECVFYDAINYKGERVGDQQYHYYWYVSVPSTGETGWIPEGQDSDSWYYLCPM